MITKDLLPAYFCENSLVKQHLDSYNKFIDFGIQEIVDRVGVIQPSIEGFELRFGKIRLDKPKIIEADGAQRAITPYEARLRNLTYSAPIFLEIIPVFNGVEKRTFSEVFIGELPVMVKSKLCYLSNMSEDELIEAGEDSADPGGYFIINGSERVLTSIEDLAPNRIMCTREKDNSIVTAKVFSTRNGFRARSVVERVGEGMLRVVFPAAPKDLSFISVVRALGLEKKEGMLAAFSLDKHVVSDVLLNLEADASSGKEDAMDYLGKKAAPGQASEYRIKRAEVLLDTYLLPHIGTTPQDRIKKAYYLCKMAERAIRVAYRDIKQDDKDHYANKRIKLAGDLMEELFRYAFQFLVKDVSYQAGRADARGRRLAVQTLVRPDALSDRIRYSMATGNWIAGQTGVSQLLDRTSFLATTSHLRRIISPLSRKHPHFKARDLHGTHWGKLCVAKDTRVLLCDGATTRSIGELENCWEHNTILSYDHISGSQVKSALCDYQKINPAELGKKSFRIAVESGREIEATEDHPFLTANGWKNAGDLSEGEEVLVYPFADAAQGIEENESIIVSESDIERLFPQNAQSAIHSLKSLNLIPLTTKNEKLPVLARLLGSAMTDAHCGNTIEFYCGSREDAEAVVDDIKKLGFSTNKIGKKTGVLEKDGRIICQTTYRTTKGGEFKMLLVALGAPLGRKTDMGYEVPQWLFAAPKAAKREFLAGYLGGDGSKPAVAAKLHNGKRSSSKVFVPELIFHKRREVLQSGLKFVNQLAQLFAEFNVRTSKITTCPHYERKDGAKMVKIKINFGKDNETIAALTGKIGYRYCEAKETMGSLVAEYFRITFRQISKRSGLKAMATGLHASGATPSEISKKLGLKLRVVKGWLYEAGRYEKTRRQKCGLDFAEWIAEKVVDGRLVSEKIISKEPVKLDDARDFTTVEGTHSFIANGFVTHNCPNESPEGPSCALVKNLSLLCEVSIGEKEENVEQVLSRMNVKL